MANKAEHQHFIPISYLKHFAVKVGKKKYFLDAKRKEDTLVLRNLSVRDVCVHSNLYTIPTDEVLDKYILEKFYAENVDAVLPEVYKMLLDEKIDRVSSDQKKKIIYTLISLYFRTPKFLNKISRDDDAIFDNAFKSNYGRENITINWNDGFSSKFNIEDIEAEKRHRRQHNRIKFLLSHLDAWHRFVYEKSHGTIHVFSVAKSVSLITSDNPVEIGSQKGSGDVFSPSNYIQMPLDTHHLLWISPAELSTDKSQSNKIFRQKRDESFALTSNSLVEKRAESWIFGPPGTVDQHLHDQRKLNTASYCEPLIQRAKAATKHLEDLYELIERFGLYHRLVAAKVRELRKLSIFEGSDDLDMVIIELAKVGYIIE